MAVSARAEDETFWREFAPFLGLAGADPLTGGARKIQTKRLCMADCLDAREVRAGRSVDSVVLELTVR
jgi:hypothetical protein